MPIQTTSKSTHSLDFISARREELLLALQLFFGQEYYLRYYSDDTGYHLAKLSDGPEMIPSGKWYHHDLPKDRMFQIAGEVLVWLDGLSEEQKLAMDVSVPADCPTTELSGFSVVSSRSDDGKHEMLTISPAWV